MDESLCFNFSWYCNDDANSCNIIYTIKDIKLYVPGVTVLTKNNQQLSIRLSKEFERSVYLSKYKTKGELKTRQRIIDIFLNQTLQEFTGLH